MYFRITAYIKYPIFFSVFHFMCPKLDGEEEADQGLDFRSFSCIGCHKNTNSVSTSEPSALHSLELLYTQYLGPVTSAILYFDSSNLVVFAVHLYVIVFKFVLHLYFEERVHIVDCNESIRPPSSALQPRIIPQ